MIRSSNQHRPMDLEKSLTLGPKIHMSRRPRRLRIEDPRRSKHIPRGVILEIHQRCLSFSWWFQPMWTIYIYSIDSHSGSSYQISLNMKNNIASSPTIAWTHPRDHGDGISSSIGCKPRAWQRRYLDVLKSTNSQDIDLPEMDFHQSHWSCLFPPAEHSGPSKLQGSRRPVLAQWLT